MTDIHCWIGHLTMGINYRKDNENLIRHIWSKEGGSWGICTNWHQIKRNIFEIIIPGEFNVRNGRNENDMRVESFGEIACAKI